LQVGTEMYFHRFSMTSFRASNRIAFVAPVAVTVILVARYFRFAKNSSAAV
jgi:hypothetical protein